MRRIKFSPTVNELEFRYLQDAGAISAIVAIDGTSNVTLATPSDGSLIVTVTDGSTPTGPVAAYSIDPADE